MKLQRLLNKKMRSQRPTLAIVSGILITLALTVALVIALRSVGGFRELLIPEAWFSRMLYAGSPLFENTPSRQLDEYRHPAPNALGVLADTGPYRWAHDYV